jgi:hypothetical protein
MEFQLWTPLACLVPILVPDILAEHCELGSVEIVGMKQTFFKASVVSILVGFAKLISTKI